VCVCVCREGRMDGGCVGEDGRTAMCERRGTDLCVCTVEGRTDAAIIRIGVDSVNYNRIETPESDEILL